MLRKENARKDDEIVKITNDLVAAHAEVKSSMVKEANILKITKRYKESCKVHTAWIEELEVLIAAKPLPDRTPYVPLTQEPRDQIRGLKPPLAAGDSNTVSKRTRSAKKSFPGVFESALIVEYEYPTTTSKRKKPNVAKNEELDDVLGADDGTLEGDKTPNERCPDNTLRLTCAIYIVYLSYIFEKYK